MACVLVVDDDIGTRDTCGIILRARGIDVVTAGSAEAALECVRRASGSLIVSDLRLPDLSGVEVLRHLRQNHIDTPFVIMTGFGTVRSAVEALKLGAADYLEKPLEEDELIGVVERCLLAASLAHRDSELLPLPNNHALQRWSDLVLSVLQARNDPKTLDDWGSLAHAAKATLENWCRAARLPTKASLDFARMLRAVVQARRLNWKPADLLHGDSRTLERLIASAGLTNSGSATKASAPTIAQFLAHQTLISDQLALGIIKTELARRGIH